MTSLSSLSSTDTCSYLDDSRVALIAANATDVALRVGTSFGNWSSTANSTNTLAITALQNPGQTWHNGATWDNWDWSHTGNPICATGWPNMYHASGNQSGVHWVVGDGLYQTWYPVLQQSAQRGFVKVNPYHVNEEHSTLLGPFSL